MTHSNMRCAHSHLCVCRLILLYLWPCSTSVMQPTQHALQHTACQDLLLPAVPVAMQHIVYATHSTCMALQTAVSRYALVKVLQHVWMKFSCQSFPHSGANVIWCDSLLLLHTASWQGIYACFVVILGCFSST